MNDVIVTGLPRSGSALASALIDFLPDSVSLNTPPWHASVAQKPLDVMPYCKWLTGDYIWTRKAFLDLEPIGDFRDSNGIALTDGMADPRQPYKEYPIAEGAPPLREPALVYFTRKGLSKDFTLAMRQHTLFTSILPTLVTFKHFKIIAIIRHPLDVIGSWTLLPQPMLSTGNPPGIARFWPESVNIMEANLPLEDRLVQLYDAFLGRYHGLRDHVSIVTYEELVENPNSLATILGKEPLPERALTLIKKRPRIRNNTQASLLREAFKKYGVFTKLYYPDI